MSDLQPVLRTCGFCRGTGRRNGFDCLACKGAGLVWCPVPDAGYPDKDWLHSEDPPADA
jgi:hypothetical protein